jgi:hypothetical protein
MQYDTPQQSWMYNPQQSAQFNPQASQAYGLGPGASSPQGIGYGLGQAAYGQQFGQAGFQPPIGAFGWGAQQPQWWGQQQRQLSQHDVSEVVRQLLPALPQIIAQAQQPNPTLAYAAYGQMPRMLTQQDVNEVVRQLLPLVPQIVGALQGQPQLPHAAMYGGSGPLGYPSFTTQGPFATSPQPGFGQFSQYGLPQFQSAFATPLGQPQRQLSQQDITEVTRQLVGLIPQVISNLQAFNQQRMI